MIVLLLKLENVLKILQDFVDTAKECRSVI